MAQKYIHVYNNIYFTVYVYIQRCHINVNLNEGNERGWE